MSFFNNHIQSGDISLVLFDGSRRKSVTEISSSVASAWSRLGRLGLRGQSTAHQPSGVPPNKSDRSQGTYKVPAGKQAPGIALSECADWGLLETSEANPNFLLQTDRAKII